MQSSLGGQEISATISADGTKLTVVSDSGGRTGTRFIPPIHTHSDTAVHPTTDHSFTHIHQTHEDTTNHEHFGATHLHSARLVRTGHDHIVTHIHDATHVHEARHQHRANHVHEVNHVHTSHVHRVNHVHTDHVHAVNHIHPTSTSHPHNGVHAHLSNHTHLSFHFHDAIHGHPRTHSISDHGFIHLHSDFTQHFHTGIHIHTSNHVHSFNHIHTTPIHTHTFDHLGTPDHAYNHVVPGFTNHTHGVPVHIHGSDAGHETGGSDVHAWRHIALHRHNTPSHTHESDAGHITIGTDVHAWRHIQTTNHPHTAPIHTHNSFRSDFFESVFVPHLEIDAGHSTDGTDAHAWQHTDAYDHRHSEPAHTHSSHLGTGHNEIGTDVHAFEHTATTNHIHKTPEHTHDSDDGHATIGADVHPWRHAITTFQILTGAVYTHESDDGHITIGTIDSGVHAWEHRPASIHFHGPIHTHATTHGTLDHGYFHNHTFNHTHFFTENVKFNGSYSAKYTIVVDDGDGIGDRADPDVLAFSNDFSDGFATGTITDLGDQFLLVTDPEDSRFGVIVRSILAGPAPATVSVCGGVSTFELDAIESVHVRCGSVTLEVITGTVEVTFIAPDGTETTAELPAGNSLTLETETFTVSAPASNSKSVVIVVNDVPITLAPGAPPVSIDVTAPTVSTPEDITAEATSADGAAVSYEVTAEDAVGVTSGPSCTRDSGSTFAIETTTVTCTASDAAGNVGTASFDITVVDTTPPVLSVPDSFTIEGNTINGANVDLPASTAVDIVDPDPVVDCTESSGFFPLGDNTVTCAATDGSNNTSASQSYTVTVVDTTPPVLTVPDSFTEEGNTSNGANVDLPASTAVDIVDPDPVVDCTESSGFFPLGDNTVTCDATDGSNNTSASQSYTVTVVDTTPPVLTVPASITLGVQHHRRRRQHRPADSGLPERRQRRRHRGPEPQCDQRFHPRPLRGGRNQDGELYRNRWLEQQQQ